MGLFEQTVEEAAFRAFECIDDGMKYEVITKPFKKALRIKPGTSLETDFDEAVAKLAKSLSKATFPLKKGESLYIAGYSFKAESDQTITVVSKDSYGGFDDITASSCYRIFAPCIKALVNDGSMNEMSSEECNKHFGTPYRSTAVRTCTDCGGHYLLKSKDGINADPLFFCHNGFGDGDYYISFSDEGVSQ